MKGLQWPGLFHILASSDPFESPNSGPPPISSPLLARDSLILMRPGEAVVVRWMQHGLYDVTRSDLEIIQKLKPNMIMMVEQELNYDNDVKALHYSAHPLTHLEMD